MKNTIAGRSIIYKIEREKGKVVDIFRCEFMATLPSRHAFRKTHLRHKYIYVSVYRIFSAYAMPVPS